jgi:GT2 family glycosyltransferase
MRILGHIHTFNDKDVIDRSLQALLDQTYRLDEILIVDNASTDGTLKRSFPEQVTVIRHGENLGTSGAVITGMQYALEKGYDWIWVMDGDSAPRRDALENLTFFYNNLPHDSQKKVYRLSSLLTQASNGMFYGASIIFASGGGEPVRLNPQNSAHECDGGVWSGSLFKVEAIRAIGLPSADYVLDWGEFEYSYRSKIKGYKAYVIQSSILDHNISGHESMRSKTRRLGPLCFNVFEFPPIRCYYETRNRIYFWLYEYKEPNLLIFKRNIYFLIRFTMNFLLRPKTHKQEIFACLRGIWDGIRKNMHHRY